MIFCVITTNLFALYALSLLPQKTTTTILYTTKRTLLSQNTSPSYLERSEKIKVSKLIKEREEKNQDSLIKF
jgi:hypothetical protein